MSIITTSKDDRVMIFIDIRNVMKSVETMQGLPFKLDYFAMARQLAGQRKVVAAYIFDSKMVIGEDDKSKRFHDRLRYDGFRVISRDSYDVNKNEQKEVDVALACEMVEQALRNNYDVAIVVSGDRDFIPAIQHVQAAGKQVEVAAFRNAVAGEVERTADRFYALDALPILTMNNPAGDEDLDAQTEEAEI